MGRNQNTRALQTVIPSLSGGSRSTAACAGRSQRTTVTLETAWMNAPASVPLSAWQPLHEACQAGCTRLAHLAAQYSKAHCNPMVIVTLDISPVECLGVHSIDHQAIGQLRAYNTATTKRTCWVKQQRRVQGRGFLSAGGVGRAEQT